MELSNESKTLFIPLLGKARMSKEKIFLNDPKAEEIISKMDSSFLPKKQSKWLSMYMSLRAFIIDELCNNYMSQHANATIIHLGCGLDSRCLRVNQNYENWYDIDYENVIEIRKKYYEMNEKYKMIGCSITDPSWMEKISKTSPVLIIAEGLTMYLSKEEISLLLEEINNNLGEAHLLFDAYSNLGVKLSKIKNPVNQVKAKIKYGFNRPEEFIRLNKNLKYLNTHFIKKEENELHGLTKIVFNHLYCGMISKRIYKIYEFKIKKDNKKGE